MYITVLGIKMSIDQKIKFESHFSTYKALPNATLCSIIITTFLAR